MPLDINKISTNLSPSDSGIWFSRSTRKISYPKEGNALCFGIEEESFWFRHRNRCIVEAVRRYPPGGTIFDVGGGNGVVSMALQRSGAEVCLVEPGLQGASNAIKRGLKNVICSTLEDGGFKKNSLPAAGIFDVLEHIEDDDAFLETIRKALVKGGRLFVTAPAYNFLWSKNDERVGHFRRYTIKDLKKKLAQAGFCVEYGTYFFMSLPVAILLWRTLPTKLGIYGDITAEVVRKEHDIKNGTLNAVMDWLSEKELSCIKKGGALRFGSNCLIVAKKTGGKG